MANRSGRPILGLISLVSAIATPVILVIPAIILSSTLVASPRDVRSWPDVIAIVFGLGIGLSPMTALVAIVTGHIAVWRDGDSGVGRAGLILGYIWVFLFFAFGVIGYWTWQTITPSGGFGAHLLFI